MLMLTPHGETQECESLWSRASDVGDEVCQTLEKRLSKGESGMD